MEAVLPQLKPTPLQLMLWTNFWSFVVLITVCVIQGDLVRAEEGQGARRLLTLSSLQSAFYPAVLF